MNIEKFRAVLAATMEIHPEARTAGWDPQYLAEAIAETCPNPEDHELFLEDLKAGAYNQEIAAQLGYR